MGEFDLLLEMEGIIKTFSSCKFFLISAMKLAHGVRIEICYIIFVIFTNKSYTVRPRYSYFSHLCDNNYTDGKRAKIMPLNLPGIGRTLKHSDMVLFTAARKSVVVSVSLIGEY